MNANARNTATSRTREPDQSDRPARRRKIHPMQAMNLTSMLDVCFLLLIYFILTASFTAGEGILPANLIGEQVIDRDLPDPVLFDVVLTSHGGDDVLIMITGSPDGMTSFNELHAKLARYHGSILGPETQINIRADATVAWRHVVNAFNQAYRARFEFINLAEVQQ